MSNARNQIRAKISMNKVNSFVL